MFVLENTKIKAKRWLVVYLMIQYKQQSSLVKHLNILDSSVQLKIHKKRKMMDGEKTNQGNIILYATCWSELSFMEFRSDLSDEHTFSLKELLQSLISYSVSFHGIDKRC